MNGAALTTQLSAGDYLQKAGTRYLTGLGTVFLGGIIVGVGSGNEDNTVSIIGGVIMFVGGITSLTGHFQLIKAGKAMNRDAVTLSPSKQGLGLAINF